MIEKLLYQQHIMWYESKIINSTLNSLEKCIENSPIPVDLKFCINLQTYLETPIHGTPSDMVEEFRNHPIFKSAEIVIKTNDDEFYNVGDWRRDTYANDYLYTIWGESDCIIPSDYFYILSQLNIITEPHIVSLSSRKMWDETWDIVEHEYVKNFKRLHTNPYTAPSPLNSSDIITLDEMNSFNQKFDIKIAKINTVKIDGSLLALSRGLPTPFIAPNMKFVKEDTCAEAFFKIKNIPQYLIATRIKGHNYGHPLKRTNTKNTREDLIYKKYANESAIAMHNFLNSHLNKN